MDQRYFFDKRYIKKGTKKYGLMMLICLPILVGINYLLGDLATGWVIFIDVVLALFIIIVLDLVVGKIQARKEAKQKQLEAEQKLIDEAKLRAERIEKQNSKTNSSQKKKRKRRNRSKNDDSNESNNQTNG